MWCMYILVIIPPLDVTSIQDNCLLIFSLYTLETFNCLRLYTVFNYEASVPYKLFFLFATEFLCTVILYIFFSKRGILFWIFNSSPLSFLFNSQFEAVWGRLLGVQAVETFCSQLIVIMMIMLLLKCELCSLCV